MGLDEGLTRFLVGLEVTVKQRGMPAMKKILPKLLRFCENLLPFGRFSYHYIIHFLIYI